MTPLQQMLLGLGKEPTRTYAEDIYASRPYDGSNSNAWYENGVGLAEQVTNRLVWVKSRSHATKHWWFDTVRGANSGLSSGNNDAPVTTNAEQWANNNFQTNGFVTGYGDDTGATGREYASWTFGTAPGFFDIVTYTGTGSSTQISHSLSSVPGLIIIKKTSHSGAWVVYHRSLGNEKYLNLNSDSQAGENANVYGGNPTATDFTVGADGEVNQSGHEYIAYLFAGGGSTDSTAKSVDFDGTGDYLSLASSSDFDFGTDDYTIECWINVDAAGYNGLWTAGGGYNTGVSLVVDSNGKFALYDASYLIQSASNVVSPGQWYHVAVSRSSNTVKLFLNGIQMGSATQGSIPQGAFHIGAEVADNGSSSPMNGKISNFRVVKGTAVYTSSFKPPTAPLTNITNTKLLCCNDSSVTGSTVTPGTITANGDPTASTIIPFDDTSGSVFGAKGNAQMIKTGSYIGNGSDSVDIDVYLGWEPQFLLVKQADNSGNWQLVDSATTWPVEGYWETIRPNRNDMAAVDNTDTGIQLTSTGFKIVKNWGNFNTNGETHVYMAIRRPDAYVAKPITLGSDVFSVSGGLGSGVTPNFSSRGSSSLTKSIFPVDFAFEKSKQYTWDWQIGSRLGGKMMMEINTNEYEVSSNDFTWDYKLGWNSGGHGSERTSWMWRRSEGIDVVYYTGRTPESLQEIPHGLNQVPEMMWFKRRTNTASRLVYHIGLNGGTNPENYYIVMGGQEPEGSGTYYGAPTSTHFSVLNGNVNGSGDVYQAILFASVTGVSKVTYWAGDDSASRAISFGFQPRFVLIRIISDNGSWNVWDSHRGFTKRLKMDTSQPEDTQNWFTVGTDGITLTSASDVNTSGENYICYAHA
tara:strand:+ start:94 stop:2676 length:2583 start_codon:yes stop_codon:yes gene_type:complete